MKFNQTSQKLLLAAFHNTLSAFSVYEISDDLSTVTKKYTIDTCFLGVIYELISYYYSNIDVNYDSQKNTPIVCFAKRFIHPNICYSYLGPYYQPTYVYGVLKLNPNFSLNSLFYVGTEKRQYFTSFTLDQQNNLVLAGHTPYNKYVCTPSAYDPSHNGNNDLLVVKIDSCSTPFLNISNTTPANLCIGDTIQVCQLNPAVQNSYLWTGPNNFLLNGTNCLYAPAHPSLNGVYNLQYLDAQGCTLTTSYTINVNNVPSPTVQIITQPSPLCPSSIASIQAIPNNLSSYSWNVYTSPPLFTYTASSSSFTINPFSYYSYYMAIDLLAYNSVGCRAKASLVNIVQSPEVVAYTSSFPYYLKVINLYTNTPYSFQWLDCSNNMQPIAGATLSSYTVTQNGSYAAAWAYGSCSGTTACQTVSTIGLSEFSASGVQWMLYPNPSDDGRFYIYVTAGNMEIEMTDASGKILYHRLLHEGTNELNLNLPAGVYFIREKKSRLVKKWVVH